MKVYSPVLDKKVVVRGERILYGDYRLDKDTNAVLVQYGYADGLERKKRGNLINNRCMNVSAYSNLKVEDGYGLIMDNAEVLANPAYAKSLKAVDAENAMTLTGDDNQYFHSAQVDVGSKVSMIIGN